MGNMYLCSRFATMKNMAAWEADICTLYSFYIETFMNTKEILNCLFSDIEKVKNRAVSAGTKFRLMALLADIAEVAEGLQEEILQRVSQEAAVDVDVDTDFALLAEQVLAMELPEAADAEAVVREQTQSVNEALGLLSGTLADVDVQLSRHHRDEEYARLYEQEKRRYLSSGTASRAKRKFEEWKDLECNGHPQLEHVEDYRTEKLLHMFEKGALASSVEHIQRAKRYPGEVDFEQLDEDHPLKKTVYKHYAALRKLVDFRDGCLMVDPVRVGRHFYACRKDANAKADRTNFLKYMHKIDLAQEELRQLLAERQEDTEGVTTHLPKAVELPERLLGDEASVLMGKLVDAEVLTDDWQPSNLSCTERGLVAKAICDRLDIKEVWQVFGQLWDEKPETLRSYLNKALDQKKSLIYQEKLKKILG